MSRAPQITHGGMERKAPPKALDHVRIYKGEKGGHIIEHHFTSYEHQPEKHPFSKDDGEGALAHVAKHMGIAVGAEPHDEEEEEEVEA
jgi:hypothetical protein